MELILVFPPSVLYKRNYDRRLKFFTRVPQLISGVFDQFEELINIEIRALLVRWYCQWRVLYRKEGLELTMPQISLIPKCSMKEVIFMNWIIWLRLHFKFSLVEGDMPWRMYKADFCSVFSVVDDLNKGCYLLGFLVF